MQRTRFSGMMMALSFAGLLGHAALGGRGQEQGKQSASLTITWEQDGRLVITGSGFVPREQVFLTISVQSQSVRISGSSPGAISQSSQSSSQNLGTAIVADASGRFRHELLVSASGAAELTVTATGNQGSTAHSRRSSRRPV